MKSFFAALAFAASIAALAAQSVTLAWDPSTSTNVVQYRVFQSDGTNTIIQTTAPVQPPATNQTTFSNLVAGRTYTYYCTAMDDSGLESVPSNTAVWTVPFSILPLPAFNVRRTTATVLNGLWTIPISWNGLTNLATYGISNYWVNIVGIDSTNSIPVTTNAYTVRGLPVASYTIWVSATNAIGASPPGLVITMSGSKPNSPQRLIPHWP